MAEADLHQALARHIAKAIPGMPDESYMRAAKAASSMWRDEWRKGYLAGKESGLSESTHGGEIATLRARLQVATQRECPDRDAHVQEPIHSDPPKEGK